MNDSKLNQSEFLQAFIDNNETTQQYSLSPALSSIFLAIDITLLMPICYFHYLIARMVRREIKKKSQVFMTNLLACYAIIVPVTFILIFAYVNVLSRYSNPPSEVLGGWFCSVFELFGHASFVYLGAFSLFTAIIKYWYIVKNGNARRVGEEKASTIFLISHLVIPIIMAGLNSISNGNKDLLFWVNHCWGHKPKTDSVHSGISEQIGDFVCSNRQYDISKYVGEKASHFIEPIQQGICGGLKIFYLALCSNMAEFTLYILVFKYLNR